MSDMQPAAFYSACRTAWGFDRFWTPGMQDSDGNLFDIPGAVQCSSRASAMKRAAVYIAQVEAEITAEGMADV